jgi:hypothetical protein
MQSSHKHIIPINFAKLKVKYIYFFGTNYHYIQQVRNYMKISLFSDIPSEEALYQPNTNKYALLFDQFLILL